MTVLQRIVSDISCAYTDVPMILGTDLHILTKLVKREVEDSLYATSCKSVEWNENSDWYSPLWYHRVWEGITRPIVLKYLEENKPTAWFKNFYK